MRIEIADAAENQAAAPVFPPLDNYVDLRHDPRAIEQMESARRYLPIRNLLTVLNGAESVYATSGVSTDILAPTAGAYEFVFRVRLVFAAVALNFERSRYADLCAGLKELLERDPGDTVRGVLRVCACDFAEQDRRGSCVEIQLTARGDSREQAEMRWGLALARVQQALLFRARVLSQRVDA